MKKMQCEVCGSTSIKKVGDTVFECQSCGTQYSREEVQKLLVEITGTVKIDHAEDIENTLKRAEQFEQEGDIRKAEQYYEKVLDMEPENSKATEKIANIKSENAKPQNLYILEKTISEEKAFDSFLSNLKTLKNIAPDIYKEIEIISKKECYYPFAAIYGTYSGTYSGTACFRKKVEYTDWENYTDYVNGKPVKRRRPVTKTRIEIDKQPASGSYSTKCRAMYSLSADLTDIISDLQLGKTGENIDFLSILEKYFDDSFSQYSENIKKIDIDNIDVPLAIASIDNEPMQNAQKLYEKRVQAACSSTAHKCVGGDQSENVRYSSSTVSQEMFCLYIPIQVVEYAYKGNFYVSTMALVDDCHKNNLLYPYYNRIDEVREEGNREVNKTTHKGYYGAWAWLTAAFFGGLGWFEGLTNNSITSGCYTIAIGCAILGALQTTLAVIKLIQANKLKKEYQQKTDELSQEKDNELTKEFKLFFSNYKGIDSIENCTEIVRKNSTFSCKDEEISCRANNDYFDDDHELDKDEEDYADDYE